MAKQDQLLKQLEDKLAETNRAMDLMQTESQQQADAALAKLQQSLDAARLEEVRKVKEELSLEKERAVEDLTKQCRATRDEYNQLKASYEQECLALQEQLQVLQETATAVEAIKIERDDALRQLNELSETREADVRELKQASESQLKALQVQHASEVKQLQQQLEQAQVGFMHFYMFLLVLAKGAGLVHSQYFVRASGSLPVSVGCVCTGRCIVTMHCNKHRKLSKSLLVPLFQSLIHSLCVHMESLTSVMHLTIILCAFYCYFTTV